MTKQWQDVRVVCSHGLDDVPPKVVEIFTFSSKQDHWVPTVAPHCLQQIRARNHEAALDTDAGELRLRYARTCPLRPCHAQFKHLYENLEPMLYEAAYRGDPVIDIKPGPKRRAVIA